MMKEDDRLFSKAIATRPIYDCCNDRSRCYITLQAVLTKDLCEKGYMTHMYPVFERNHSAPVILGRPFLSHQIFYDDVNKCIHKFNSIVDNIKVEYYKEISASIISYFNEVCGIIIYGTLDGKICIRYGNNTINDHNEFVADNTCHAFEVSKKDLCDATKDTVTIRVCASDVHTHGLLYKFYPVFTVDNPQCSDTNDFSRMIEIVNSQNLSDEDQQVYNSLKEKYKVYF